MKKLSLFALAAAGLLLGACSDKDAVNEVVNNTPDFTEGAFIGVTLQLPSVQNSTRANEDFDDGESDEFAVKNATLYIFKGATEDAATFVGQYTIGTFEADGGTTTDNVTSTYREATQISNELAAEMSDATNTDNYYGYVIVNNPGVNADATGITFEEFRYREWDMLGTPTAEQEDISSTGLLMTNAPVCSEKGGDAAAPTAADKYSTLVLLDKTKIFATAAAAKADPAGCIFIERAAVKITVALKSGLTTVGTDDAPTISFEEWQIINYPEKFYNTRKVDPAWGVLTSDYPEVGQAAIDAAIAAATVENPYTGPTTFVPSANWNSDNRYRFVSKAAFHPYLPEEHDGPFRTYFAEDATYNADGGLERPQAIDGKWIAMNKRGFTTENTFDVEHQKWVNTTQVTFKTIVKKGDTAADFYTINGGDKMYDITNAQNAVQNGITSVPAVLTAINAAIDALIALDKADDTNPDHKFGYIITPTVTIPTLDAATDNITTMTVDFTVEVKEGTNSTHGKDNLTEAQASAITTALTNALKNFKVSYYKGGVTYYTARIQHFGEYETPWSATMPFATIAPGETVQQIYGVGETPDKSADRFLGRYGVVRDNWYKLSVDAVNHIGTAEPLDVSGDGKNTPDDEIENFISVHVHIVPWVLRNQSINF